MTYWFWFKWQKRPSQWSSYRNIWNIKYETYHNHIWLRWTQDDMCMWSCLIHIHNLPHPNILLGTEPNLKLWNWSVTEFLSTTIWTVKLLIFQTNFCHLAWTKKINYGGTWTSDIQVRSTKTNWAILPYPMLVISLFIIIFV